MSNLYVSEAELRPYTYYLRRCTSLWYVVLRGDAWSSAPSNTHLVLGSGASTTDFAEFDAYTGNVTNVTDAGFSTGRAFKINYPSVSATYTNTFTWNTFGSFDNASLQFKFKFDATPAVSAQFLVMNDCRLWLDTAKKLELQDGGAGAVVGPTVLTANTVYQVEINRTKSGTTYLRINETDECNDTGSGTAISSCIFGATSKTNAPNCNIYIGDIAFTAHNDTPAWWNTTVPVYGTVDAAGTYNDAVGIGDATNKYLNVDDYAASDGDTTYNGLFLGAAAKTQTHGLVDGTFAATIKGVTFYMLARGEVAGERALKFLIRDNGIDYTTSYGWGTNAYTLAFVGYDHCPNGDALTQARINAMEMGFQVAAGTSTSYTTNTQPTADGSDTQWTGNPNGTPNKFTNVDAGLTSPDDTDYIEDSTLNDVQAFTYVVAGPDAIYQVILYGRVKGDGSSKITPYVKIGANYYYGTEMTPTTSFASNCSVTWTTNPDTSAQWTLAEINAARFGFKVTSIGAPPAGPSIVGWKTLLGVGQS